jgi:oligoendopeptidase F
MNFNGTYDSVSTAIHELGHSMNSYYYNKKQPVYSDTTIFTAEIPSIVNEILLAENMLKKYSGNKEMKTYILRELIDNFFGCTTRQIIFSNFEYIANDLINNSQPFTKENLRKVYLDMMDKYIGIKNKKKYDINPYAYSLSTIFRIPHFYAGNFYVYKYAIGQIVAVNIASKIISGDKNVLNKYFEFLSSGTSKSPLDTIKILGIDLTANEPYIVAKKYIEEKIKQY